MYKLACLMMAASLGAAVMATGGAPYEQLAQHFEINQANAAEVIKTDAHQAVMRDAQDHPPLPAGMKIALPQRGDRDTAIVGLPA